ncbi:MAG: 30S ribosomal protein S8 [Chloroflexia bacterium]
MTLTDPIADMLTRIRNALMARHEEVLVPSSRLKEEIARILQAEGLIQRYEVFQKGPRRTMRIVLKYTDNRRPVLTGLSRVSKPGRRIYVSRDEIPRVKGGLGFAILSTSKGVMTGEEAWRAGVGGEVICYVW